MMPTYSSADIKYVSVNATADGDNTVIAAVAGKSIMVLGYALSSSAAGTVVVQDTNATPAVLARLAMPINGVVQYAGGPNAPAFKTASGEGLELNNPTAVDVLGHMAYLEV